jgi:hypothetical protein
MKRTLRIATFVLIQLLLLVLVVEVGLRVLKPSHEGLARLLYIPAVESDFDEVETLPDLLNRTILGFKPYEDVFGFIRNSRGLRTPEYTFEKKGGTVRVIVIGDSFAFSSGGIPHSDCWPTLLEKELERGSPHPVELITLAAPGIGPLFERRLWQVEGSRLDADVLLLQLFVGNDFTDNYKMPLRRNVPTAAARVSLTARLVRNLGRVLGAGGSDLRAGMGMEAPASGEAAPRGGYELPEYRRHYEGRRPMFTWERLMQVQAQRARLCDRSDHEAFVHLFSRVAVVVEDFRDEVEAAGVDFHVVVIPDRFQINVEERAEIFARLDMRDEDFDWDKPQRAFRSFFENKGISYLDLLPAFREASRREPMYATDNTHWNIAGNAFGAREIGAWLTPLLPQPAP